MLKELGKDFIELRENTSNLFSSLGENLSNWFSGLGDRIGSFFSSLGENIGGFFSGLKDTITEGFSGIADTFISLFIPSEEEEQAHLEREMAYKEMIEGKFEFVTFIFDEVEKAKDYTENTDFLKITIPSFKLNLGVVNFETPEMDLTNVKDAYEPYRLNVRSLLAVIVYGMAIVYYVKLLLNYGVTSGASVGIDYEVHKGGSKQ